MSDTTTQEPEFLFDAVATTPLPCGNRVATPDNPVKVKLEAPKKRPAIPKGGNCKFSNIDWTP